MSIYAEAICRLCNRKCYILKTEKEKWSDCPDCKKKKSDGKGTDGNKDRNEDKPILGHKEPKLDSKSDGGKDKEDKGKSSG